jgi:hypothetical protein
MLVEPKYTCSKWGELMHCLAKDFVCIGIITDHAFSGFFPHSSSPSLPPPALPCFC